MKGASIGIYGDVDNPILQYILAFIGNHIEIVGQLNDFLNIFFDQKLGLIE